jgi:hypothetical protein
MRESEMPFLAYIALRRGRGVEGAG